MNTRLIHRRTFLHQAALGGVALTAVPGLLRAEPAQFPGFVVRERMPANLEFPFPALDAPITPNHRFFVRSHFPVPKLESATWKLKVDGSVNKELTLDLDAIRKLPSKTIQATIECAGNGRAFLTPQPRGLLWEQGAVGNAEWTGVPLSAVLEQAGLAAGTVEVILGGADRGEILSDPRSPGPIAFERSVPVAKAKDVLLAYRMNGQELPPEHGFPLRAVVAGWYGMASVKWLVRVTATKTPFQGFWQTLDYSYWKRDAGGEQPTLVPLTAMQVKSQIARPASFEVLPAGVDYRVFGAAWAGENDVAKVEVTSDGKTWQPAKLLGNAVPFAWRLWELPWKTPKEPGRYRLMARATDSAGRVQPEAHDKDRRTYMIHHTLPIEVIVA